MGSEEGTSFGCKRQHPSVLVSSAACSSKKDFLVSADRKETTQPELESEEQGSIFPDL